MQRNEASRASRAGERTGAVPGALAARRRAIPLLWLACGVTALWAVGATGLILAGDTLAAHLVERQVAMQYSYEEQIASMRARLDKLASRQMFDQDTIETRVADLAARQSLMETRGALVAQLSAETGHPPVPPAERIEPGLPRALSPRPVPIDASVSPRAKPAPVGEAPLLRGLGADERRGERTSRAGEAVDLEAKVRALAGWLDGAERAQAATLSGLDAQSRHLVAKLRLAIADTGLDPEKVQAQPGAGRRAEGGPFVAVGEAGPAPAFEAAVRRVQAQIAAASRLRSALRLLPLRHPLSSGAEMTSSYGVRSDPFTRGMAMHTGVDFRAEHGAPVRATGTGRVVTAEHSGGYGNMVEIDHGNGLTSRYAHLSSIEVDEGEEVEAGALIGKVGSTGRSTGAHLHYETRLTGDPTDPARFLRAGSRHGDLF